MKKLIYIIFLFVLTEVVHPQWIALNSGIIVPIYDVYFLNENTGIVAGYQSILRTSNGGLNWLTVYTTTNSYPKKISFVNSSTGYVCGSYQAVIKTTNAGLNWELIYTGETGGFNSTSFITPDTGLGVMNSGYIYRTYNGGLNWTFSHVGSSCDLKAVTFINANIAYAGGSSSNVTAVYKTNNSGISWSSIYYMGNSTFVYRMINDVFFFDANTGFKAGGIDSLISGTIRYGSIDKTTNGGYNWVNVHLSNIPGTYVYINRIYFCNSTTGSAVGWTGRILRTTNSGSNWNYQTSGTNNDLNGIYFINPFTGYAVGNSGTVLKTTNGGGITFVNPISNSIPVKYSLSQNYPNPFNPTTKISYKVKSYQVIKLVVYNILGKEVETLVKEKQSPGEYEVTFDGSAFPSGVYFYKLSTVEYMEAKKMLLIK